MAEPAPFFADLEAAGEEGALWRAMRAGSAPARERLFTANLPFARALARREYRTRGGADVDFEDLLQLACAGLLEAMDRYDPDLGVPFAGFAARRINGSMIDGLGKMSEVREQIGHRHRARRQRLRSLAPDAAAGAQKPAEAMEALVDMAVGLALGFMLEGTGLYHDEAEPAVAPTAYDSLAWKDLVQRLTQELTRLPDRDRAILQLHYLEDVNFYQIAAVMALTKGRISQLHKAALTLLRKRISGAGGFRLER
jgi:RNA polymerase sigma factor for flagellar operon FliA